MAQGITAVNQLIERAKRLEVRDKKRSLEDKQTIEKTIGFVSALASSGIAGYVDGRFDVSGNDTVSGDGMKIFGVPVIPVAAGLTFVGSMAVGGSVGNAMMFSALGMGCGFTYSQAARAGLKANETKE